ncbi:uncharacterized protein TrAtP1_010080 [Trichoderma atroviride]|uniref:Uncharacterized protein n=1 Tax=Hypocrea atroviridis (strain ATCC 20476 / IMI 206040) TaxID=452589 RepID=G9NQB7_HYPAI|nr:uncharacterized protein TRIATDRAFT_154549 [Trichoderma atroviride IMI 206040]EHK47261.1 hypothetical protein TRIATDRAFT_154549 [Trichoderma atroviride IMI 206040]UKZ69068.1 hypothetical protein TrAtP1_010080 [Trichoderma atroviride]
MAELDMDVDLAPPMKFDEHADEDLIDYDIDTTEDHSHEQSSSHQDEHTSGAPERVHPVQDMEGANSTYTEVGQAGENFQHSEVSHPQGDMDYEHAEDAVKESHQDKDTAPETEQAKDFHETDGNAITGDIVVAEAEHAVDEIDYEDEDATVTQDFLKKPGDANSGVQEGHSNDDMAAAGNIASTTTAEPASLLSAEAPVGSSEVPEPASKDDEDEITWENDGEDDAEKHGEHEPAADVGDTVAEYDHAEIDPDQVYEQHAHATDSDYDADAAVEVSEEKTSPAYHQDDSLSQAEEQDSEAADFPAITVQYKGDEFPFFSQEKTEGFFSDLSVLDHSMESVLVGLRSELENEIAAQDELVFQVDELGLEFAEATAHDALTTITLRQVLEVFDLLVKNQDPDSSRTLYTYLFTRSSASKRFEFLSESAAAGRGLDEVIHLFENPIGHHHGLAEAEHEHGHDDGEDSETNEATEIHESAEDDDENEENEGADADTEQSEASEEDEEEEDEDEEETSAAEEQPVESADQYEDEEEEEEEEDEDVGEDFMAEAEDFIRDAEENANQEGEYSDDAEESYEQLQAVVVEPVNHSGHADATAEADDAPDATYSYDDEDEDADANPFIHLEMQETMVDDGVEIQYETMAHVEEGNQDSHQLAMHPVDEYIDTNEAETGTTNTLADNAEAISTLLDIGADQGLEEITNEDLAFEDEMPEIDWRDDVDAHDDAKDEMAAADSGLSKRRRSEDEQGVEDEQDAKRRRP